MIKYLSLGCFCLVFLPYVLLGLGYESTFERSMFMYLPFIFGGCGIVASFFSKEKRVLIVMNISAIVFHVIFLYIAIYGFQQP